MVTPTKLTGTIHVLYTVCERKEEALQQNTPKGIEAIHHNFNASLLSMGYFETLLQEFFFFSKATF